MDMVIVAVLVACVLVVLLVIGLYERELRRMAHFLNKREKEQRACCGGICHARYSRSGECGK